MSTGNEKLAELDARLQKLADRVRTELPERAQALRAAVERLSGDEEAARKTIGRLAHMVRGTAGSHGMPRLTEPAARVEAAAQTISVAELIVVARVLADELEIVSKQAPTPSVPPPAPPLPVLSAGLVKPLQGRRVLAIDDDSPTRRLLMMTLANLGGATTVIEESPKAFFAALEAGAFDVVIVDAMMPEMNGLACLQRIAGSPLAHTGTRYVVLSAASPEELAWSLPAMLPITWLRKPFRPRELLDAIGAQLAR